MSDEIYQGKYAWVLTPDVVLAEKIKNIGSRFSRQTAIANERPYLCLSGGQMTIAKSKIIEFRNSLLALKDENITCHLKKVGTRTGFLVATCDDLSSKIRQLIISTEVFLQPYVPQFDLKPLSGSVIISRLQKGLPVETFEHSETFNAEHLQFVELDDNLFIKTAKFTVF